MVASLSINGGENTGIKILLDTISKIKPGFILKT